MLSTSAQAVAERPRVRGASLSAESVTHADVVRAVSSTACLQLWRSVVLQILADIDAGLRVLRGDAAPNAAVASTRRKTVREAHDAAMWLFGQQTRTERTWIAAGSTSIRFGFRRPYGVSMAEPWTSC